MSDFARKAVVIGGKADMPYVLKARPRQSDLGYDLKRTEVSGMDPNALRLRFEIEK